MEFEPPKHQGDNPVCNECHNCFPHIWHDCTQACSHLISWTTWEMKFAVIKEMAKPEGGEESV